jgi:hypothetical protein
VKGGCKNITIGVPEGLLNEFRVYAASQGISMNQLLETAMRKMMAQAPDDEARRRRILARLENPPNLGTNGKITWTRDEIHER